MALLNMIVVGHVLGTGRIIHLAHYMEISVQVSPICKDRRERALNKAGSCTQDLLVVCVEPSAFFIGFSAPAIAHDAGSRHHPSALRGKENLTMKAIFCTNCLY